MPRDTGGPARASGAPRSTQAGDGGAAARASAGADRIWRRLRRDPSVLAGTLIVAVFAVVALAAPIVATHDPLDPDPSHALQGPSRAHFLGTDDLGRDVFSRVVFGARLSLGTAVVVALVVLTLGVSVGVLAGTAGGWTDTVCMRIVDGLLAFPSLILVLAVAGTLKGGLPSVVTALAAVSWVVYARLVRGLVVQLRERDFIEASRAAGASPGRIAVHHLLPHVMGPVIVLVTIEMGGFVLAVSALSFLGAGAQPPTPEWGTMLDMGRPYLFSDPWLMIVPGLVITLAALGFNLLGEGLRDVLDPKGAAPKGAALTHPAPGGGGVRLSSRRTAGG
jgi:peptide/nickel transport system permease protein